MALSDMFYIVFIIFVAALCSFLGTALKDAVIPAVGSVTNGTTNVILSDISSSWDSIVDRVFFFTAVGLSVGALVMAALVNSHPIFFFISLFMLVILMLIVPVFTNMFGRFTEASVFTGYTTRFPLMSWMMQHFTYYVLGVSALMLVVTFAKISGGG